MIFTLYPWTDSTQQAVEKKLEMCPQYMDAPAVGYLTIKLLQNSTWYKWLNLSLTGSCMYLRTHIRTEGCTFVRTYPHTENQKTICPRHKKITKVDSIDPYQSLPFWGFPD